MIRQLSAKGLTFLAPRLVGILEGCSDYSHKSNSVEFVIAEEKSLLLEDPKIGVPFSQVDVDVIGYVKNIPFVIYVTYKGRDVPAELKEPEIKRCGIVEVRLDRLLTVFKHEKAGQYIEALIKYIEEKTEGKSWVYHPRSEAARKNAELQIASWQSQQKLIRSSHKNEHFSPASKVYVDSQSSKFKPTNPPKITARNYDCMGCKTRWASVSPYCEKCKTHLYTRVCDE